MRESQKQTDRQRGETDRQTDRDREREKKRENRETVIRDRESERERERERERDALRAPTVDYNSFLMIKTFSMKIRSQAWGLTVIKSYENRSLFYGFTLC